MQVDLSDEESEYSISIDEFKKLPSNNNIVLNGIDYIDINLNGENFDEYINKNWDSKKRIMQLVGSYDVKMQNGIIDKRITNITYNDDKKPFVLKSNFSWKESIKIYK